MECPNCRHLALKHDVFGCSVSTCDCELCYEEGSWIKKEESLFSQSFLAEEMRIAERETREGIENAPSAMRKARLFILVGVALIALAASILTFGSGIIVGLASGRSPSTLSTVAMIVLGSYLVLRGARSLNLIRSFRQSR